MARQSYDRTLRFVPRLLVVLLALLASLPAGASAAITLEEGPDTVETPKFKIDFCDAGLNVEFVQSLEWRNSKSNWSGNLAANSFNGTCGEAAEFWGESYGNEDGRGPGPVVSHARGTWTAHGQRTVEMADVSDLSGDSPHVPVRTRYTFFEGAAANMIRIERSWSFAANQTVTNPAQGMRTYVARLPNGTYNQEIYPNGETPPTLTTEGLCNVCFASWNRTWVAVNASSTNSGMVILRDPADSSAARLVLDYDSSSGSNNTGVSLDMPAGGWTAPVSETEYLCFYDAESWPTNTRSPTNLPPGCAPKAVPVDVTPPSVPGAGAPEPGKQLTVAPGTWEGTTGPFAYQWSRCLGSSCEAIGGATGTSYVATAQDVGHYLRVAETATAPGGETDTALSTVAGSLSGFVTEGGEGLPAKGAFVQACEVGGGPCRSATTDSNGFYRIQAPVSGEYEVTGFPPPGSKALPRTRTTPTQVEDEAESAHQDLVLTLPTLPPPSVGFGGSGVRGKTAEGVPVVYWQEPFVIEYEGDVDSHPEAEVEYPDGEREPLSAPGPPIPNPENEEEGTFDFPVEPLFPHHGPATVYIEVEPPTPPREIVFPIYIDPSGFVRTVSGSPLPGATVTLFRAETEAGPFAQVPNGSAVMSPMNRANPDRSEAGGHFGWDVIAGYYKVRAEAAGCHAPGSATQPFVETQAMEIPPPVADLDLRLECPLAAPGPPAIQTPVVPGPTNRPRPRPRLDLPRRGGTVKVRKNGAFAIKAAKIGCPAASAGPCSAAVAIRGKGRSGRSLGASELSVPAGKAVALAGKLSKRGLASLTRKRRLAGTISVSVAAPGGDRSTGSLSAAFVPAKTPR